MKKSLALILLLWMAGAAHAQNWPAFRGANGAGIADGAAVPFQWDVEKGVNILWKREIPGFGHSSPVIWGDLVFLTTAVNLNPEAGKTPNPRGLTVEDKDEHEFRVYALNRKTGEVVWQHVARKGVPRSKRHPASSHASSTPVTNGKILIAYFGSDGLYAYDLNGKLLWQRDLGTINTALYFDPDQVYGTGTSPVLYKDLVIIQADKDRDSFIAAFSLEDGKEVWRQAREGELPSWSTPILVTGGKRDELITQAYKFTRSYDPATGKELWRFGKNGEQHIPSPVLAGGTLYFTSGGGDLSPVYAIRPGASGDISLVDGQPRSEHIAWYLPRGGVHIVSPLVYQGNVYVLSDNGVVTAFDAASGERRFRARLGSGGTHFASPTGINGHILFVSQEGEAFVIKAGNSFEQVAHNKLGEGSMSTPAVSGGTLFIRGYKHLFAIAAP
jgi:outer membrane protein assembly factor BamB